MKIGKREGMSKNLKRKGVRNYETETLLEIDR
jgi:hypothetical protein